MTDEQAMPWAVTLLDSAPAPASVAPQARRVLSAFPPDSGSAPAARPSPAPISEASDEPGRPEYRDASGHRLWGDY